MIEYLAPIHAVCRILVVGEVGIVHGTGDKSAGHERTGIQRIVRIGKVDMLVAAGQLPRSDHVPCADAEDGVVGDGRRDQTVAGTDGGDGCRKLGRATGCPQTRRHRSCRRGNPARSPYSRNRYRPGRRCRSSCCRHCEAGLQPPNAPDRRSPDIRRNCRRRDPRCHRHRRSHPGR